ncbi:MAG: S8 family peptidase [Chloroflexi bacterium]|nr:S8 family peptidase [Chloroflexota bacterium]MCI0580323.1 S8 family peptidase [Chloroflexota bacterium]MCI0648530.1 S8 family peptidase [Chloroflexota bacterium]MCI0728490.1 S8 family peptidase [Chloroflexota bacterium]
MLSRISRKTRFFGVAAALLLAFVLFGQTTRPTLATGDAIPGRYIIKLAGGVESLAAANDLAREHGLGLGHVYSHAFNGFSATVPDGRLNALQNDARVVSIVPDRYVTINHCTPRHPQHCEPTPTPPPGGSQTIPTGIRRINGDLSSTASGDGSGSVNVDVAVIDTGIDLDHPDLDVAGGVNCSQGNSYNDGNGHGSHVSGTIGALDNNIGVVGVAPGARLWAVRVLNNAGSGSWASVICGVDWVTANAGTIEVANMSLGGTGSEGSCNDGGLHEAICNSVAAGVTYAVAAGNESDNAANHVPAAYNEVITVSALADFDGEPGGAGSATCRSDVDDTLADFSNFGSDVDIIAPGVCIESTWKGGGYNTISGTSMASPHVAGAAALYKAGNPGASPSQVKSALQNAGNLNWNDSDDPDGTQERLLDVDGF